ncbi:hypothetical protein [Desulforamulus aeronauticus]|uniref:Uncharacterized protein n=1 Tax=Desulforamulus aeronauticus DSM 10349 TaxID=1121421 RepID=A0A1M6PLI5_9FIRM|nr:hypothetical protein [Desulforamulus aeronauticus]SHK08802.1 hypothetical protein SAMN02745123_00656 [Desulforamulus aeronauticus DSM 10349]
MVKRSLKAAIGVSAGITIGGIIIPRIFLFPELYNKTFPSIVVHSIMYFIGSYIVSFLSFLLIEWMKSKFKPS